MARIFIVRSPKDDSWLDEYLKKKEEYIEMEKERPTYSFDVYETIADFSKAFNTWSTKREKVLEELEALDKREELARVTIPTTMVGVFTSRRTKDYRITFKELEYVSSLLRKEKTGVGVSFRLCFRYWIPKKIRPLQNCNCFCKGFVTSGRSD